MRAKDEFDKIHELFKDLLKAERKVFPGLGGTLDAPKEQGVYIIYSPESDGEVVLHVGRTLRGKNGLQQRLQNHLSTASSFTIEYFKKSKGGGSLLRGTHTFSFLVVAEPRERALLEAYAVGMSCPKHLGLGSEAGTKSS